MSVKEIFYIIKIYKNNSYNKFQIIHYYLGISLKPLISNYEYNKMLIFLNKGDKLI